jgi:BirA family transcriptional regulator, biotin operon repressor / biotin---[acetyl-CoA-carboxylase] ligase
MNFKDKVIRLKEVDSTNSYAKEILKKFPEINEGTTIVTGFQTSGLGQNGNYWESHKEQNILLSTILHPEFLSPDELFYLNISVSLAIFDFVESFNLIGTKIKWPNDIYVGNKKIAGVLIYNDLDNGSVRNSIIGIGININQELFNTDIPNPVSLKNILNKESDLNICLEMLLNCLENRYTILKNKDFDKLYTEYHDALYLLGQESVFIDNNKGEEFQGIIDGVRADGRIRMITPQGIRFFEFREIKYIF